MTSWVSTLRVTSLRLVRSLWYLYGPQGETRQLTNSAGTVTDTYSYTAYGSTVSSSTNDANPFQYGGKFGYYTENNGVVLCEHRWYDTLALRWLSRDPAGYEGGDNLYAYCGDDPVTGIDPSGLAPTYPYVPPILPPRDGKWYYWYNNQWNKNQVPGIGNNRNKWTWDTNPGANGHAPHYDYRNGRANTECRYYPGKDDTTPGEWEPKYGGGPRLPGQFYPSPPGPPNPGAGAAAEGAAAEGAAAEDVAADATEVLGGAEAGGELLGPAGMIIGAGIAMWDIYHHPQHGITTLTWIGPKDPRAHGL